MRIIFVRHGEPDYINDCLTPRGREQAAAAAERLRGEKLTAVYSSPMGRAWETASYTAKAHGLEIQELDFMHEISWGDLRKDCPPTEKLPYDGHPWTLGFKLMAEGNGCGGWEKDHRFADNVCMEYYRVVSEGFDGFLAGFGIVRRGGIYTCAHDPGCTVALFAHGGSGAVMFSHLFSLPFPFVLAAMPYGVCSVSVIDLTPQDGEEIVPRLELFNDMRHLPEVRKESLFSAHITPAE